MLFNVGRQISLFGRRSDSEKDRRRVLRNFAEWQIPQRALPAPRPRAGTLLLIRLDDIGDYLVFRNQLGTYRQSPRWRGHEITLLANESWKALFTLLDQKNVDRTIWVNKNRYLENAAYRQEIWTGLREGGFETAIAPSHMRPLLLDDLCVLAAAAVHTLGCVNNNVHPDWNVLSDALFTSLFKQSRPLLHEFDFNAEFTLWACGARYAGDRPTIQHACSAPVPGPYVVCFVGASTRSKRWPARRWIQFIRLYRRSHAGTVFLAGNSRAELEMVRVIQQKTGASSIAGTVSLAELLDWIGCATAVITNDTMAAHIGVSLSRPTVIIANGTNYMRFSEYRNAGIDKVATIYPEVLNRRRRRSGDTLYAYSEAVSADIASIPAAAALKELDALLAG